MASLYRRDFLKHSVVFPALGFDELRHLGAVFDDARCYLDVEGIPSEWAPAVLCEALSHRLAEPVTLDELGLTVHCRQGLELAAASMDGKRYLLASPRERALFGVVYARALGAAGQKSAAAQALITAEDDLASGRPHGVPPQRAHPQGNDVHPHARRHPRIPRCRTRPPR